MSLLNVDDRPSSRPSSRGPEGQARDRPHSRGGYEGYYDYGRGDYRRSYSQDDYYRQYDDRYRGNVMLYLYIYLAHISEQVCIFVIKFLQPGRL